MYEFVIDDDYYFNTAFDRHSFNADVKWLKSKLIEAIRLLDNLP